MGALWFVTYTLCVGPAVAPPPRSPLQRICHATTSPICRTVLQFTGQGTMANSRSNPPRPSKKPSGRSPGQTGSPSTRPRRSCSSSQSTPDAVARIRVQLLLLPEVKEAAERAARELAAERDQPYSMGRYIEDAVITRLRREKRLPSEGGDQ